MSDIIIIDQVTLEEDTQSERLCLDQPNKENAVQSYHLYSNLSLTLGNRFWAVHVYIQGWCISVGLLYAQAWLGWCRFPQMGRYGGYIGPSPTKPKKAFLSHLHVGQQSRVLFWLEPRSASLVYLSIRTRCLFPTQPLSHRPSPLQTVRWVLALQDFAADCVEQLYSGLQIMYSESYLARRHRSRSRNWTCPLFWLVNPQITWVPIHLLTDLFVDHYLLTDPFVDQPTQSSHHLFQPPTVLFWPFKLYLFLSLLKEININF